MSTKISFSRQEFNQCFDKEFEGFLPKITMGLTVALNCSPADLNNCYRSHLTPHSSNSSRSLTFAFPQV